MNTMRSGPLFFAFFLLLSVAILAYFGTFALAPLPGDGPEQDTTDLLATPLEQPEIVFGNPSLGPKGAFVTIVEFGDYLCQSCATMVEPVREALKEYEGSLRFVWKDLPNTDLHPEAYNAAMAARCAGLQGAFWSYHDKLFANQNSINDSAYSLFAQELGLNVSDFQLCMDTEATKYVIREDVEEAIRLGIDATPYLFIGDSRVSGPLSETQFLTFVRLEMAKAEQALGLPVSTPTE